MKKYAKYFTKYTLFFKIQNFSFRLILKVIANSFIQPIASRLVLFLSVQYNTAGQLILDNIISTN